MRSLLVSPEPPYPLHGGGALRTASLLQFLAQHSIVDIALFAVDGASDPAAAIPPGLVRNVVKLRLPSHSKRMPVRLMRNAVRLARGTPPLLDRFSGREHPLAEWLRGRRYDVCLIEHFWCAPYVETVRAHADRVLLDLHNIESEWHHRIGSDGNPFWRLAHHRFAEFYRRRERALLPAFDAVLTTSSREAAALPPTRRTIFYPNAIPHAALPQVPKDHSIAFSGNLEYAPNQQAVRWFARHVWPLVLHHHPDLRWRIIGKNPQAIAHLVAGVPNVECTGPVDDAVAALARSQIAIVPVLTGSGTRVKILEAWAAQLSVVATRLGAEGLDAEPGVHFILADTPAGFAASLSDLLRSPEQRQQLGCAGRHLLEEKYTWEAAWQKLAKQVFSGDERLY